MELGRKAAGRMYLTVDRRKAGQMGKQLAVLHSRAAAEGPQRAAAVAAEGQQKAAVAAAGLQKAAVAAEGFQKSGFGKVVMVD